MYYRFVLILIATVALHGAESRPFTLDSAFASIANDFPQARRVSEALPPGVVGRENLTYAQHDGVALQVDVYRKSDAVLRPAVLLVHGGGWIAGHRSMERALAIQLAARGYVAVPVSYRLGEAGRFPNAIHDLKAAVRWLRARAADHSIDSSHIGIIGGSAGGTLATFIGATSGLPEFDGNVGEHRGSSAVQAVVNLDGLATFLDNALIAQSEGPPSPYYVYQHGTYRHARATWAAASPLLQVGPHSAPTLFVKSTSARPILPGRDEMAGRLGIFGIASSVIQFPDTPHVFWLFHPWFDRVVEAADRFLRPRLGIEVAPAAGMPSSL